MNTSAEAADQIVRMTLNGTETALKITGAGAEKIGKILYKLLRDLAKESKKTKGQMRLSNMIKSGKKLEIFEIPDANLKRFCELAKSYGVTYSILKDKSNNDGFSEIMVKADDTQKINHIYRRLEMAVNNVSQIETNLGREKDEPERVSAEKSQEDKFIDELMRKPNPTKEEHQMQNPTMARMEKSNPSVPSSESKGDPAMSEKSDREMEGRPSVRAELKKYKEADRAKEEGKTPEKTQRTNEHKHVEKKKKPKTKERE